MENIIKVKLGDIKSNYSHYSPKVLYCKNIFKFLMKECFFILLFGLVGVLFTILFHKKCFYFFNKYIDSIYINPSTYKLGNGIFSRVILIIISLLITINTFILILYKLIETVDGNDETDDFNGADFAPFLDKHIFQIGYGWAALRKSLKDNGYDPHNFKNGYITVEKFKGKYNCTDGNHRHSILLDIYGPDKIIDVVCDGIDYKN